MPFVRKKGTKKDNVGGFPCLWTETYVPPRNMEEMTKELKDFSRKWGGLVMHYSKVKEPAFAILCLFVQSDINRLLGQKSSIRRERLALALMKQCGIGGRTKEKDNESVLGKSRGSSTRRAPAHRSRARRVRAARSK